MKKAWNTLVYSLCLLHSMERVFFILKLNANVLGKIGNSMVNVCNCDCILISSWRCDNDDLLKTKKLFNGSNRKTRRVCQQCKKCIHTCWYVYIVVQSAKNILKAKFSLDDVHVIISNICWSSRDCAIYGYCFMYYVYSYVYHLVQLWY